MSYVSKHSFAALSKTVYGIKCCRFIQSNTQGYEILCYFSISGFTYRIISRKHLRKNNQNKRIYSSNLFFIIVYTMELRKHVQRLKQVTKKYNLTSSLVGMIIQQVTPYISQKLNDVTWFKIRLLQLFSSLLMHTNKLSMEIKKKSVIKTIQFSKKFFLITSFLILLLNGSNLVCMQK